MRTRMVAFFYAIANRIAPRLAAESLPAELSKRDRYIMPTAEGIVYAAAFFLIGLLCISYRNNMAFGLLCLLMGYFLANLFRANRCFSGVFLTAVEIDPGVVDTVATVHLRFQTEKPVAPVLSVFWLGASHPVSDACLIRFRRPHEPGVYAFKDPLSVITVWPNFSTRLWVRMRPAHRFAVLPAATTLAASLGGADKGVSLEKVHPSGDPFSIRPLLDGESAAIAWKASLRANRPMVFERATPVTGAIIIPWPSGALPDMDKLASMRAHSAVCVANGSSFSMVAPDGRHSALGRGESHERHVSAFVLESFCLPVSIDLKSRPA